VLGGGLWWGGLEVARALAERRSGELVRAVVAGGEAGGMLERAVALDPRNREALRLLAVWQEEEGDAMGALVTRQQLAEAGAEELLVADMAEARFDPGRGSAMRAVERLAGGSLAARVTALRWAVDIGEYEAAASLVQPAEVLDDPELFAASVRARSVAGGWREWSGTGPDWLGRLVEASALGEEGKEGDEVLMEGLAMAREERETMVRALGFLAAVGDNVILERELKDFLAARPDDLDDVLRGVLPALRVHRDKARMFRMFELATGGEHGILQPDLADEADRLALLLGKPVDVEAVVRRSRENNHRMTHALALLKQDDAHGAFALLDSGRHGRPHRRLPARQKMVVASVLAGVGRRDEARRLVATIPPREIRKEERRLFANQMARSLSIGSVPKDPRLVADSPRDRSPEMGDGGDEDGERPPDPTERVIAEILEAEEVPLGPDLTRSIVLEAMAEAAEEAGEGE
jgi:hypothetical protein